MAILPWTISNKRILRGEKLLRECCDFLGFDEKRFDKDARKWIYTHRVSDDSDTLRRYVYYAVLISPSVTIKAVHFPPQGMRDFNAYNYEDFKRQALEDIVAYKIEHFFERLGRYEAQGVYKSVVEQVERPLIQKCLHWADGNQVKAARVLGLHRNTLREKIKQLKLDDLKS